jgi:hypothetical protein
MGLLKKFRNANDKVDQIIREELADPPKPAPEPDRTYRNVQIPSRIWADWTSPLGDAWRLGVDCAKAAH